MNNSFYRSHRSAFWLGAVCVLIGIIYVFLAEAAPFTGDDLVYKSKYTDTYMNVWLYPLYFGRHYLSTNGRAGDMINILFFNTKPSWILSLMIGLMMALYVWMTVRWSLWRTRGAFPAGVAVIALVILTFQWWDSFLMFVIQINYVWSTALVLTSLYLIFSLGDATFRRLRWLLAALALLAGMMHEAASTPICAGWLAYLAVTRSWRQISASKRMVLIFFAVGAVLTVLSPGIIRRFSGMSDWTPDDPFLPLVLKSDYYALLLTLAVAVALCFRGGRRHLAELAHTPWLIFTVGAFTGMIVSGLCGVVGRSGWFAQTYAIIALMQWVLSCKPRVGRVTAAVGCSLLLCVTFFHLGAVLYYQRIVGRQTIRAQAIYAADPSKPVYMDYMHDKEVPWWVLNKTKGMIDEDDFFPLEMEMKWHGEGKYPFIVLPVAVGETDFTRATFPVDFKEGFVMLNEQGYHGQNLPVVISGEQWMCVPFTQDGMELLFYTERDLDPGDRLW